MHRAQHINCLKPIFNQYILIFKMGQMMLESCEMECKKIGIETRIRNRSEVYFSNMGAQLPEFAHNQLENLKRSKASLIRNNEFLLEINKVPSHYAEFVNYLFVEKKKFEDNVFPASANSIIWGGGEAENDWARLSDMSQSIAEIYRNIGPKGKSKTRIIQILQLISQNFAGCLEQIRPIYLNKVGLAVCHLHINGNKEQVVVDDLIPTTHLRNYTSTNHWFFLIEKAFAKLIGNYAFVEEFTLPELFQEITGLPFQISKRKGEGWLNRDSSVKLHDINISTFKEVIQDEKVCYIQGGYQISEVYNVRIIPGHEVRSFPFQNGSHSVSLFRIFIQKNQKLSIRLSTLNPKFQSGQQNNRFIQSQIILYKVVNGNFVEKQKDSVTLGHNLYLGCPFIKLDQGQYILYVKRDNVNQRASLVSYAGEGFKIKQIHSKQMCNDLLKKLKKYERK